jgi:hypothetical protein
VVNDKKIGSADSLLQVLSAKIHNKTKTDAHLRMLIDVLDFYKTQGLFGWITVGAFYIGQGISKYNSEKYTTLENTPMFERGQSIFLAIDTVMSKSDTNISGVPYKYRRFRKPGTVIDYNLFVLVDCNYRISPIFFKMLEHLSGFPAMPNQEVFKDCENSL